MQKPNRATPVALEQFHTHDYIDFLQTAKPDHVTEAQVQHYNVIDDSPIFDGVFKFCQIYAGASIHGAQKLIQDDYDIAINWAGGLHHAKKGQASGEHPVFPDSKCCEGTPSQANATIAERTANAHEVQSCGACLQLHSSVYACTSIKQQ